jgi:hypothetical protein
LAPLGRGAGAASSRLAPWRQLEIFSFIHAYKPKRTN